MSKATLLVCAVLLGGLLSAGAEAASGARRTVIYNGAAHEVGDSLQQSKDLWLTLKDLTRVTKFVLKTQGMCYEKLCFPIPKARTSQFINKQGKTTWFNVSEFARLVHQPVAYDESQAVWYFGPRADEQSGFISSLEAPNFSLPDQNGAMRSLADFRGKKVLLITWASW
jgi:hypothetical protein